MCITIFCFQVEELGLQKAYSEDDAVYKYIRKLMALPFLPRRQISPMFLRLQVEAQTEPLQSLVAYIRLQWIESTVFLPNNWSVYRQAVRTNNDIEGWHIALSRRVGGQCGLSLYSLIELLDREARLTPITSIVSDRTLKQIQRKQHRNLQARLFGSWEKYERKEKTAAQLLETCSHLNGPTRRNCSKTHDNQTTALLGATKLAAENDQQEILEN